MLNTYQCSMPHPNTSFHLIDSKKDCLTAGLLTRGIAGEGELGLVILGSLPDPVCGRPTLEEGIVACML